MVAGGIAAAMLAGCTASTPATQTSAAATTSAAVSPAPGWQAAGDVDGDGGAQFVTVSETTEPPQYTTWTYERDTYAWSEAELVPVSKRTGQVTSARPGSPPAAYSGVSCGDLPQYAPPYTP